jgi:hypothetical protein
MLERLFPREGSEFYEFFERHAGKTREAAERLRSMLGDLAHAKEHAAQIKVLEHEGDEITHRTIELLHQVFLAPIERADIHRLISRLDDILDLIDSTAERLWLYEIREAPPLALELADVLTAAVTEVRTATTRVRNLRDLEGLRLSCDAITRHEKEADGLVRQAIARLFEREHDAIRVMMWKEIYRFLEDAIDRCDDVGDVLEGIAIGYT